MTPESGLLEDLLVPPPGGHPPRHATVHKVAQQAGTVRVDPAAYRPPGSPHFVADNPGRPAGVIERKPRMPRDVKGLISQMFAGLVRWDETSKRSVMVHPDSEQILLDDKGQPVWNPTLAELTMAAMHYSLQDVDHRHSAWDKVLKHLPTMSTVSAGRGFRIVMYTPGVDPMHRGDGPPVIRGQAKQLVGASESPASAAQGAQEARSAPPAGTTQQPAPARRSVAVTATLQVLRNRDGDILEEMEDLPDPNEEPSR